MIKHLSKHAQVETNSQVHRFFLAVTVLLLATAVSFVWHYSLASAALASCSIFPPDNVWNARVDTLPLDPHSAAFVSSIGSTTGLHPDFGSGIWEGGPIGIPYTTVPASQPLVNINYTAYGDESDPGPFPIPRNAPIEGGAESTGDRHVLVVDRENCMLFELYNSYLQPDGSWNADSGAKYDLNSNALRPETWTSADAAGLPIFPGLVRYEEVAAESIKHALRFTAQRTQKKHIWPARHDASSDLDSNVPPMGQRFRLKASFDLSHFPPRVQVILNALKTYGMILADNGSNLFISGAPDPGWDNEELVDSLRQVQGSAFEAVDESGLMVDPNSGATNLPTLYPRIWFPLFFR